MIKRARTRVITLGLVVLALTILTTPEVVHLKQANGQVPISTPARISTVVDSTPHSVLYQGYVTFSEEPYNGIGFFKFAVTNEDAAIIYWSNDGTLDEPITHVPVDVLDGYFTILLGDTSLSGMLQELDPDVFQAPGRYLKVWFATSPSGPFNALSPVPIASSPYAINADTLDGMQALELSSTAAFAGGNQTESLGTADAVIRYVDVTAQSTGQVLINASLYAYHPADGDFSRCSITTGTALDPNALSVTSNAGYASHSMTRGFAVSAGMHRFNLVCDANSDLVTARDSNITAIFVPGNFSALSSPDTNSAITTIPEGCMDGDEAQCGP